MKVLIANLSNELRAAGGTCSEMRSANRRRPRLNRARDSHMKQTIGRRVLLAVICGLVGLHLGCSPSSSRSSGAAPTSAARRAIPAGEAARLAARLANEQCESQYRTRPFLPDQYSAVLQEGTYRWGGLDVGGPRGFSALVTFGEDGSQPHVEVYFSNDALRPQRLPVVPPESAPRIK